MSSQRSYIETVTIQAARPIPSGPQTLPSPRRLWNAGSSTQKVHPIEIDVHEMRAVHDKKRATREASIVAQIASAGLAKSAFPAPSLAPPGLHPGDVSTGVVR